MFDMVYVFSCLSTSYICSVLIFSRSFGGQDLLSEKDVGVILKLLHDHVACVLLRSGSSQCAHVRVVRHSSSRTSRGLRTTLLPSRQLPGRHIVSYLFARSLRGGAWRVARSRKTCITTSYVPLAKHCLSSRAQICIAVLLIH